MRVTCRKSARVLLFSHHRLLAWGWLDTYFQLLLHKREKSCWCWPGNAKPAFIRFGTALVFVGHWRGQVLSSKYDEGCFSAGSSILSSPPSNIISSHSIGAELKRANFLLLPTIQAEPSHHWQILHSQHCTVVLLLYSALICSSFNFCILLERLTQPRLTLYQEYPSYLLDIRQ